MRRRTRRRVQDTLRSNRSADCGTGADTNAAKEGPEKQYCLRTTPVGIGVGAILAVRVSEEDNCAQAEPTAKAPHRTACRWRCVIRAATLHLRATNGGKA